MLPFGDSFLAVIRLTLSGLEVLSGTLGQLGGTRWSADPRLTSTARLRPGVPTHSSAQNRMSKY